MKEVILFFMCFVFVFLIYQIFIVSKAKKKFLKKNKGKKIKGKVQKRDDPMEIRYLVTKYHLDLKKVNYYQLLQVVALVSSFDISLIVSIIMIVDGYLLQLLIAMIIVIPIIMISYYFVFLFYKKKGMICDD